ncbi:MAG: CoA ester lyase [Cytophagales bacterium]|nr:CoA ester lyase [Cytophagales bacterium]
MKNPYLMRSLMFVPGHNERLLNSASRSDADVLLLDLEDSVQPEESKQVARDLIKQYLNDGRFEGRSIFPRVNDRESGQLLKDVYQLTIPGIAGFMYPKSRTAQDIYFFDKLLETIEFEKGIEKGHFKIIALIETSAAVVNINEICACSDRVVAVAYGCEDFVADLEGIHDAEGMSLFVPRALIAMAARANNVIPVDTVHIKVHDLGDLERNLKIARNLGFEGMLVLNPKELPIVHQYFSPTPEEVNDALDTIQLYNESKKNNVGVAIKNNKFIGPPMVTLAEGVLERNRKIESKNSKR